MRRIKRWRGVVWFVEFWSSVYTVIINSIRKVSLFQSIWSPFSFLCLELFTKVNFVFCFYLSGHFLYVAGAMDNPKAIELSSPWYQESGPYCKLSVALHMNNMEDGNLKIVVETRNHTWVIVETLGNGLREWVPMITFYFYFISFYFIFTSL